MHNAFLQVTFVLLTFVSIAFGQQFPDAPEPVQRRADGGLQHDKTAKDKPALTKTWYAAHAVYLGSVVFDAEMTHQGLAHHACVEANGEPHPSRGELYRNGLIEFGLLTGFDLLMAKARPPKAFKWVPFMGAGYGSFVHFKGGIEWAQKCW